MFFEQNPILDALWTIGVFLAAWCLATLVMAFLGYCIHNGLWWTEPSRLALNGNGGRRRRTAPTTAMPPAPGLEVDADGKTPAMPPAPGLEVDADGTAPAMPPAPGLEVDADGTAPAMPPAPGLEVDADGTRRRRCHRRRDWKLTQTERRRRCHRRRDGKLMEMERRLVHPQVLAFHPSAQIKSQTPRTFRAKRNFEPGFIGNSKRPRSARSVCWAMAPTGLTGRRFPRRRSSSMSPARKKYTIRDLSSAARSCSRVLRRRSFVRTAQPPSWLSAEIHSRSCVAAGRANRQPSYEVAQLGGAAARGLRRPLSDRPTFRQKRSGGGGIGDPPSPGLAAPWGRGADEETARGILSIPSAMEIGRSFASPQAQLSSPSMPPKQACDLRQMDQIATRSPPP